MPNPFVAFGQQQPLPQQQQPRGLPPLTPEEEESLLSKIGGAALHGLGWVGSTLDKTFGGRAVRGLLAGKPHELASLIPFSDTLGITYPEDTTTGAELLGNKDAAFLSPEGVGGLGAEVLLDPASYLTLGASALTKSGQVAKKAGLLPKGGAARAATTLEDVAKGVHMLPPGAVGPQTKGATALENAIMGSGATLEQLGGQKLGGHLGISPLPFWTPQATFDLSNVPGQIAGVVNALPGGKVATSIGQSLGSGVQGAWNKVVGPLFHKPYGGVAEPGLQPYMEALHAKDPWVKEQTAKSLMPIAEATQEAGMLNPQGGQRLRDIFENNIPPGPLRPEEAKLLGMQRQLMESDLLRKQNAGLEARPLTPQNILSGPGAGEELGYSPRHLTEEPGPYLRRRTQIHPSAMAAREDSLKGLPASSANELFSEDLSYLKNPMDIRDHIQTKYLGLPPNYHLGQAMQDKASLQATVDAGKQAVQSLYNNSSNPHLQAIVDAGNQAAAQIRDIDAKLAQGKNLADWKSRVGKMDNPLFGNHAVADMVDPISRSFQQVAKSEVTHQLISDLAQPAHLLGQEGMRLDEFLPKAGLTWSGEAAVPGKADNIMTATKEALQAKHGTMNPAELAIPSDMAEKFLRAMQPVKAPDGLIPVLNIIDTITGLTKAGQTAFWPATKIRNAAQSLWFNWVDGAHIGGDYIKPHLDAKTLLSGLTPEGVNAIPGLGHLSAEGAAVALRKEVIHANLLDDVSRAAERGVGELGAGESLNALLPNQARPGPLEAVKQGWQKGSWLPDFNGLPGQEAESMGLVKAGRAFDDSVDNIARVAGYIAKRHQGFTPEMAAAGVRAAHYDWGNLTQFEKSVMRRAIPFYAWARQNIPAVLEQLMTNPGGKTAQAIRISDKAQGPHPGFTPDYLAEGVAVPLGPEEDGTQRFLSRLGLPFEDLAGLQRPLGMLNPLIKAPIEQSTGKQLYTGRDITDLYSTLSNTLGQPLTGVENILMNSPFGRGLTAARTIADDRKDVLAKLLNLGTGIKISDVNQDKAKEIAVRDYLEAGLKSQPGVSHFDRLYVKPEDMGLLSPYEQQMFQLYRAREQARARRRPA